MIRRFLVAATLFGLLICGAPSAHATWTLSQHKNSTSCGSSTCAVSGFSAIASGSLIVGFGYASSATANVGSASASGGGTWTVPSGCTGTSTCSERDTTAGAVCSEYILSSTGTPTSISVVCTQALSEVEVIVYTYTSGPITFDKGAAVDRSSSGANLAGLSVGTITGTNDVILQAGTFNGNATGCPNSATNPNDFPNGNAACGLINSTNVTAGTYTNTASRAALIAFSFKEAASAAASTRPPAVF